MFPHILSLTVIFPLPSTVFYNIQNSKMSLCETFWKIFSLFAKVLQFLYSQEKKKLPLALNHIHYYSYTVSMAYTENTGFQDKSWNVGIFWVCLFTNISATNLFFEIQENLGSFSVSFLLPRENKSIADLYYEELLVFSAKRTMSTLIVPL